MVYFGAEGRGEEFGVAKGVGEGAVQGAQVGETGVEGFLSGRDVEGVGLGSWGCGSKI